MFQFPNAEGREKERFGSGKGAGCGHGVFAIMAVGTAAWPTGFFPGFIFAHGAGGRAGDVKVAVNVTACPNSAGFSVVVTVVYVAACAAARFWTAEAAS